MSDIDDDDTDALDELLTPLGNDAEERCPICSRMNAPGAQDCCEHFVGAYWDGQLMWSDCFEAFQSAWSDFQCLIDDEADEDDRQTLRIDEAIRIAKAVGLSSRLLGYDPADGRLLDVLTSVLEMHTTATVETGGMLGGSGHSCYMASQESLRQLVEELETLNRALASAARETGHIDTPGLRAR